MKKLFNSLAVLGVVTAAALMSGCGGGDSSNNNSGSTQSTGFAPASLNNNTVTLTENGQSRDITFANGANNFT